MLKLMKFFFFYLMPVLVALVWSCYPSISTYFKVLEIQNESLVNDLASDPVRVRRKIQQAFRIAGTHIAMDDIILARGISPEKDDGVALLETGCGKADVYVWVPFRFRFPIFGDKIFQSCIKF